MARPILSICIPTVNGREKSFDLLMTEINRQISVCKAEKKVEVIVKKDNKEISIGEKRDLMYKQCKGKYAVHIDDDDMIHPNYIESVLKAATLDTDCITYMEDCTIDGVKSKSLFTLKSPIWIEKLKEPVNGCVRVRTPFFKTPIKTKICKKIGVRSMRFGEDLDFANRVFPHLMTEMFINEPMYIYQYVKTPHNQRYGIK
jgi:glycosyltransferase involved in cell wall biosynthesis